MSAPVRVLGEPRRRATVARPELRYAVAAILCLAVVGLVTLLAGLVLVLIATARMLA